MKTHVEFRTDQFPPYDDEDRQINPGRHGKRLAEFLVSHLPQKGFQPNQPLAQDWGWIIPIKNDEFRLWIGCGNYGNCPDHFLCFIEPHLPLIRKFFFRRLDTSRRVGALREAIDQILSAHSSIRNKRWWTYAEFNQLA